ncbi:MAG: Uma2 family endonuclease [Acidobacteriota bacterium]|nr:Uma2 family endonuclease [Acidobacteriota bacterium]
MPNATLVPVSEYLSTSYHPDREYVDGVVLERNLGERDHSRPQARLIHYFFDREGEWGVWVVPEQRLQVTATRFRVPDVLVMLGDEPDEQIITHPPFLCVEILSKDDTLKQLRQRIDEYLRFGVRYVWVLEPWTKRAYIYNRDGMQEVTDGFLRTADPEILVPLSEILK